jgi:hypothetical protein
MPNPTPLSKRQEATREWREGRQSHPCNTVAQRDEPTSLQLASAKEIELDSQFSTGYSEFKPKFKPISELAYTIKASRSPYNPSMARMDFKNKATTLNYRDRRCGDSIDSSTGKLKKSHELNFPHFVIIDRRTYQDRQAEFYEDVKFWNTVIGPFSRRIAQNRPNGIKRYLK